MPDNFILLEISLTIGAQFIGFAIAFIFFRMQQKTDFNRLLEQIQRFSVEHSTHGGRLENLDRYLGEIEKNIREMRLVSDFESKLDKAKAIEDIREQLQHILNDIPTLSTRLVRAFRRQQDLFFERMQAELGRMIDGSAPKVRESLAAEIRNVVRLPEEQAQLLDRLEPLMKNIIASFTLYQANRVRQADSDDLAMQKDLQDALQPLSKATESVVQTMEAALPALPTQ